MLYRTSTVLLQNNTGVLQLGTYNLACTLIFPHSHQLNKHVDDKCLVLLLVFSLLEWVNVSTAESFCRYFISITKLLS